MKLFKLMLCGALAAGLWSCSDKDEPTISNNPGADGELTEGGFYATMTVTMATANGSRADIPEDAKPGTGSTVPENPDPDPYPDTNSKFGYEIGQTSENNIKSVVVILSEKKDNAYEYIAHAVSSDKVASTDASADSNKPTYSFVFKQSALEAYAKKEGKKPIYAFTICNPGTALITKLQAAKDGSDLSLDKIFELAAAKSNDEVAPWSDNYFLMTNKLISNAITLPDDLSQNTKTNPLDLGTVLVERAVARFDFHATTVEGETKANFYPVRENMDDKDSKVYGYIELTDMALINQARKFYYFRRVSANGQPANSELCGREYYYNDDYCNYVVGPYAGNFTEATYNGSAADYDIWSGSTTNYETLVATDTDWSAFEKENKKKGWTKLSAIANGTQDNHTQWTGGVKDNDYRIWRYTTENVIPVVDRQVKGATTGVVFKGHIRKHADDYTKAADETEANTKHPISFAIESQNDIYKYGKTLYGNLKSLAYAAIYLEKGTSLEADFRACFNFDFVPADKTKYPETDNGQEFHQVKLEGYTESEYVAEIKSITPKTPEGLSKEEFLTRYNFSCYSYVEDKVKHEEDKDLSYAVYYTYYNRHNDNADPNHMGPMEFATVRNNVYKLAVQTINNVGKPVYDVDDPNEEDENPEVYFKVTCAVCPWVVRVNNFDF